LAQGFHHFYNDVNILNAEESDQINIMTALNMVKDVIGSSLELIGIKPLDHM